MIQDHVLRRRCLIRRRNTVVSSWFLPRNYSLPHRKKKPAQEPENIEEVPGHSCVGCVFRYSVRAPSGCERNKLPHSLFFFSFYLLKPSALHASMQRGPPAGQLHVFASVSHVCVGFLNSIDHVRWCSMFVRQIGQASGCFRPGVFP